MTLAIWLDIWLKEYVKDSVKPNTVISYEGQSNNHIKLALGALLLTKITTPAIQKFYNSLSLCPKTIKKIHGVLHSALKKAVSLRYIPFNPADECELPRVEKRNTAPR